MSISQSRVIPRCGVRISRDVGWVDPSYARRRKARSDSTVGPGGPEWKSERWKREVEAEAGRRLKRRIRDIGSRR